MSELEGGVFDIDDDGIESDAGSGVDDRRDSSRDARSSDPDHDGSFDDSSMSADDDVDSDDPSSASGGDDSSDDDSLYINRHRGQRSSSATSCDSFAEGHKSSQKAFRHCIMNFCIGSFDQKIESALEKYRERNQRANDDSDEDITEERDMNIARDHLINCLRNFVQEIRSPVLGHRGIPVSFPIDITPGGNGPINVPFVSYHPSLESHWDEVSVALNEFTAAKYSCLGVRKVEFGEGVLAMLAEKLRGRVEGDLRFFQNNLCSRDIDHIAALLEGNPTLTGLTLCDNPFPLDQTGGASAVLSLFGKAHEHPNLRSLSVPGCNIGDNLEILLPILHSGAVEINLIGNDIASRGCSTIADFIESDPNMELLNLDQNRFDDDDAVQLSCALQKNKNLKLLSVRGNDFTKVGVKEMFSSMFDSTTLDTIYSSNHFCQVNLFSVADRSLYDHVGFLNAEDWESARKTKMKVALEYSRESLLQYTELIPVELMHIVIEFILVMSEESNRADMVYTIMRWWNMPSLYTYRSTLGVNPHQNQRRKK